MNDTTVSHSLVDSTESITKLIDTIKAIPPGPKPNLFLDLEGVSLSRHGSISILAIFVRPNKHVYLVDVHALHSAAFGTPGDSGVTLKDILESPGIIKVFFDVRNDSDALHHHYGVKLQGIQDVQLMENATRPPGRRAWLKGLNKCIEYDAPLSAVDKRRWNLIKEKGLILFHPSKGGSYQVFNQRPLDPDVERYCINDVQFLPELMERYLCRLSAAWRLKVDDETTRRRGEFRNRRVPGMNRTERRRDFVSCFVWAVR
ncbi:hypothetical protein FZEAL_2332 [Fusarium zealandicum]|uniref:3'-5' exonuclease domain-containing protein n=1 Tax=Fusarium zealandicum TaxID=1053134 RepID=A0A8H4URK6_9HYPO|nr:hypothetical protein FZEAL_2332 [Fusarium zealandicum]